MGVVADTLHRAVVGLSEDGTASVWDATDGHQLRRFATERKGVALAAHPSEGWIAVVAAEGTVTAWDVGTGTNLTRTFHHGSPLRKILFLSEGRRMLTVGGRQILFWNASSGGVPPIRIRHASDIRCAVLFPDGDRGVSVGEDGWMNCWDTVTGASLGEPMAVEKGTDSVQVSPDGSTLGTLAGGNLTLWSQAGGGSWKVSSRFPQTVSAWAFAPDGRHLWLADRAGCLAMHEFRPSLETEVTSTHSSVRLEQKWVELVAGRVLTNEQWGVMDSVKRASLWKEWQNLPPERSVVLNPSEAHRSLAIRAKDNADFYASLFHWERVVQAERGVAEWVTQRDQAAQRLQARLLPASQEPELKFKLPPRSLAFNWRQVNLSAFFNAALDHAWLPSEGNDLGELMRGWRQDAGVVFDLRGVVQLGSPSLESLGLRFPRSVQGIPVGARALRLNFLHATAWDAVHRTPVGHYRIRYRDGATRDADLLYGENIGHWWCNPTASRRFPAAAVVWQGSNAAARQMGMEARVFQMAWINPRPDIEIESFDFVSAFERPAPFLLAVTLE